MVVITVKKADKDQFLYECTTLDSNDKVVTELAQIHNMREKITRLTSACEQLVKHGPMKPEHLRGLDEVAETQRIDKGPCYCPDPLGQRTGDAPPPNLADVVSRTCGDATALISRSSPATGLALTVAALQERLDHIRGAISIAYPMGLPDWDPIRMLIEDADDSFVSDQMGNEYMDPKTCTLWWAGKEFFRDQTVGDRVGKNEKTRIVARLQRPTAGAPVREPAVSEDERKAMMAWYFKKQEETRALESDDADDYLNSKWADPKALKSQLLGTSSINWHPR